MEKMVHYYDGNISDRSKSKSIESFDVTEILSL